jgi:hypothetical protein
MKNGGAAPVSEPLLCNPISFLCISHILHANCGRARAQTASRRLPTAAARSASVALLIAIPSIATDSLIIATSTLYNLGTDRIVK